MNKCLTISYKAVGFYALKLNNKTPPLHCRSGVESISIYLTCVKEFQIYISTATTAKRVSQIVVIYR
jgi:hypothetical protein